MNRWIWMELVNMNEELINYLKNHKPSQDEVQNFKDSVRQEEKFFSEVTRSLAPSQTDRERLFNL